MFFDLSSISFRWKRGFPLFVFFRGPIRVTTFVFFEASCRLWFLIHFILQRRASFALCSSCVWSFPLTNMARSFTKLIILVLSSPSHKMFRFTLVELRQLPLLIQCLLQVPCHSGSYSSRFWGTPGFLLSLIKSHDAILKAFLIYNVIIASYLLNPSAISFFTCSTVLILTYLLGIRTGFEPAIPYGIYNLLRTFNSSNFARQICLYVGCTVFL